MESVVRLGLVAVATFYIVVFLFNTPKSKLLPSTAVLILTSLLSSFFSVSVYFFTLTSMRLNSLDFYKSHMFAKIAGSGIGGGMEEGIRAQLTLKWMQRSNIENEIRLILKQTVFALGFLYGLTETLRVLLGQFANKPTLLLDFMVGSVNLQDPNISFPDNLTATALLILLLILKYFVHISFLCVSIFSLFQRKYYVFGFVIFFHLSTNILISTISVTNIENKLATFVIISIVIVCGNLLAYKAFNLNSD